VPSQCGGRNRPVPPASTAAQHRVGRSRKSSGIIYSVAMVMRYVLVLVLVLVLILTGTGTRRTQPLLIAPRLATARRREGEVTTGVRAVLSLTHGQDLAMSYQPKVRNPSCRSVSNQKEAASHIELTWDGIGREPVPAVIGDVPNFFSHLCGNRMVLPWKSMVTASAVRVMFHC